MTFVKGKAAAWNRTVNQLTTNDDMRERHMAFTCLRPRLHVLEQHHGIFTIEPEQQMQSCCR